MIVGIDLGTTHSLVSVWTPEGPRLIRNVHGSHLTPSVIGIGDDGAVLVGAAAQSRLVTHPHLTVAAFKRMMGSDRISQIGTHRFRAEELSALVLKSLIADVQAEMGEPVTEAIISVPAYFSDAQRKATRNAGALAGIHVDRLVNEPTAAALAYGLEKSGSESRFLVLDLGGGTFDVSILELFDGVMEVHATAGDNFLGGEDFVGVLTQSFCEDCNIRYESLDASDQAKLRERMERIKRDLSQGAVHDVLIDLEKGSFRWSITEPEFESRSGLLLSRMRAPIERAMRDSKSASRDLEEILLVGGASRMPMVSRLVTRMFGRLPLRHINPDEAIACGTAVMAGLQSRAESLREVVMTDVCPYSLGIEVSHRDAVGHREQGLYSPIIERNTVVPTSKASTFYPTTDFQTSLKLRIFQGESPRVSSNILLGEIEVPLPRATINENPVEVRFTYDISGIIEVEALIIKSQERHTIVIQHHASSMTPEQISERLAELAHLKIHPRDDQINLVLIARAERLYEERTGDVRKALGNWILAFRAVLESQDHLRIRSAQKQFDEALASVEAESII
jgi:molecular chaperone HscC